MNLEANRPAPQCWIHCRGLCHELGAGVFTNQMSWRFYRTETGKKIVREELDDLPVDARAAMTDLMKRANRGQALPRETEPITRDISCLRLSMGHNEFRLLFAREGSGGHILLALTALTKKDEKLPRRVIEKAETRLRDHRERGRSVPRPNPNAKQARSAPKSKQRSRHGKRR